MIGTLDEGEFSKAYKRIDEILADHPDIRTFAKIFKNNDFQPIGFVIHTLPKFINGRLNQKDIQVIGLWVFDKVNIKEDWLLSRPHKDEICQDFIEYNPQKKCYTYYSGGTKKFPHSRHQHIKKFCQRFGRYEDKSWGQYGCKSGRRTTNHRFRDELDPYSSNIKEVWVQELISNGINDLRTEETS